MARSYEELVGSLGRSVYFRPERKRVRELLSRSARPRIEISGVEYNLYDVASTGVSFVVPAGGRAFTVGNRLDISLRLRDSEFFRGPARVARLDESAASTLIGLALLKGFLDLPKFLWQDEEESLRASLAGQPHANFAAIPKQYLYAVSECANFVQQNRLVLDKHERRYQSLGIAGIPLIEKLVQDAIQRLREPWAALERQTSDAAEECLEDPAKLEASKQFTEAVITPLLLPVPMIHRGYTKPLGYPGDYKIMLYYYENSAEGDSAFARVFHKFAVEHPLSAGVRTRKDFVADQIKKENLRSFESRRGQPFRVMNLGSGPAREVRDFALTTKEWPGEIVWTLIDQEDEALSVAFNDSHRAIATTNSTASVECLHVAFSQLLNDPSILPSSEQHLIYSAGLFDYLRERRAQELIKTLYARLAPGGLLLIGNAKGPNRYFWSPEFLLDWTLLYRTEVEMMRMGDLVPANAQREVFLEAGEAYYFLAIRKP